MNLPLKAPGLQLPALSPRFVNQYRPAALAENPAEGHWAQTAETAVVTRGLLAQAAAVSPKYFYDALGSKLFEAITCLQEYYPTRTEAGILDAATGDIRDALAAHGIGRPCLIDLGAGNCAKAARLIPHLQPRQYVPVDISADFLRDAAARLQNSFPALDIVGVGMDFSAGLALPPEVGHADRLFFYPGSSLGNFDPADALAFLRHIADPAEGGARGLLLGIDLVKDSATLEAAYDDAPGVTAAFNKNLLRNLNGLLGADFDLREWRHAALFNRELSRIEMHLEASRKTTVRWRGGERIFEAGERIHTECSYKYTRQSADELLRAAGFRNVRCWTDAQNWFGVFLATT